MPRARLLAIVVAVVSVSGAAQAQKKTRDTNQVAEKLVSQTIAVKEGDVVAVNGTAADADLLEDLMIQLRKRGAFPLVTLDPSNRVSKRFWSDVPAKYDSQTPQLAIQLGAIVDVTINIESDGLPAGALADVPQERRTAVFRANKIITDVYRARNVPSISVGNGMYPGPNNAANFGVGAGELTELFWSAVNTDYAKLGQTAEALKAAISGAKEMEITHPNGTSLKVRVEGRKALVSDGVISDEERAKGGAASLVWLPAGEVYVAPVPGTAEGTIVDDWRAGNATNKPIQGLTLTFKEGRLVSMKAKSPIDAMQKDYDAAPAGKDLFGVVDIGVNPSLKAGKGKLESFVHSGMVTWGIGDNGWAGGDNNNGWGIVGHLPGATVKLDGKVIVENGVLK